MRRIFEVTGLIENGRVVLLDRKGNRIGVATVGAIDGDCDADKEINLYHWRRACYRMREDWKGERARHFLNIEDPWRRKCGTLAQSWRKRGRSTKGRTAIKKTMTWNAACRHMHAKHLQKVERSQKGEDWQSWCNNVSSNHRKRLNWIEQRKSPSQANPSTA